MRHNNHLVTDSDSYFVIDPITRQLSNGTSKKLSLIKGDHNSERFTFELPLYVEGHDMSLCNKVEVHFINLNTKTKAKNEDVYIITDHDDAFKVNPDNPDTVIAEWLISRNVTQHAGSLSFVIRYMCLGEDGTVDYAWNTAIYSGITVLDSIDNSDIVVEEYSDVLQEWYEKLLSAFDGNIDLNSKEAVKFWVGSHEAYRNLEELGEIVDDCLYIITDDKTLEDIRTDLDKLKVDVGKAKEKHETDFNQHGLTLGNHQTAIEQNQSDIESLQSEIGTLKEKDLALDHRIDLLAELFEGIDERELKITFPSVSIKNMQGSIAAGSGKYLYSKSATNEYEISYPFPRCQIEIRNLRDEVENIAWIGNTYTTVLSTTSLGETVTREAMLVDKKLTLRTYVHAEVAMDTYSTTVPVQSGTAKFWI